MGKIQDEPSRNAESSVTEALSRTEAVLSPLLRVLGRGRPRSDHAHRAILDATRDLIIEGGLIKLRLEHVATRAGVGKATIYRRWDSKEAIALDLLMELAAPNLSIGITGNTTDELRAVVETTVVSLTETPFGPVVRALLSQIAINPLLGDPFRATVVQARRNEIVGVIERGIQRGDVRLDANVDVITELLIGPVYFRLMFGGELDALFIDQIVNAVLYGYASPNHPDRLRDADSYFATDRQASMADAADLRGVRALVRVTG
jgi:AcrR family transcriptional regulator